MTTFQPVKLSDRVFWVGAVDWNLRNFHGLATTKGSTNCRYIPDDKELESLVDTAKEISKNVAQKDTP